MKIESQTETLVPIWVKPGTKQAFIKKVAYETIDRGKKLTHDQTLKELINKK